jgi:hypothetical protein
MSVKDGGAVDQTETTNLQGNRIWTIDPPVWLILPGSASPEQLRRRAASSFAEN